MGAVAVEIPFVREMCFSYAQGEELSPLVRRVVARNPGPFTGHGTNTYLVGRGRVAVIDPGPSLEEHQAALRRALNQETVSHVLVTHRHLDHSESAGRLAAETGAALAAGPPPAFGEEPVVFGEAVDRSLAPDRLLAAGDFVDGPGWRLEVLPTPGHTSDHLCFALPQEAAAFTGDHVMGWSTSVVIPPDGDMRAYLASLRLLQARRDRNLLPGHGPVLTDPAPYLAALIAHREEREAQIVSALADGVATVPAIVEAVYTDVDPGLHPAAALSVLAHLRALVAEGRAACWGEPSLEAKFQPV
jgi:glyoxylase-like metal-dependent hydrolase (beta-lactamase superfamily II)